MRYSLRTLLILAASTAALVVAVMMTPYAEEIMAWIKG